MPRGTGRGNKNAEQTPRAIESWLCKQMCFLIVCRKRGPRVCGPARIKFTFFFLFASQPPSIFPNKSSDSAALIGSTGAAAYGLMWLFD